MTDAIPAGSFDFDKWYAAQDPIAERIAKGIGAHEANDKWSADDYEKASLDNYERAKTYARTMTEQKGVAWIASAHGGVQPAQDMLGDRVGGYLK